MYCLRTSRLRTLLQRSFSLSLLSFSGDGVRREFFKLVLRQLFHSTDHALFMPVGNSGQLCSLFLLPWLNFAVCGASVAPVGLFLPNPESAVNESHLEYFQLAGTITALAILVRLFCLRRVWVPVPILPSSVCSTACIWSTTCRATCFARSPDRSSTGVLAVARLGAPC
jgi:hypothetical protein